MADAKINIRDKIAEQLAVIAPSVIDQVVEAIVGREVNKRSDALVKVIDKLDSLEKEKRKLDKPDQTFYNAEGEVDVAVFSECRKNERAKNAKNIERHVNAINKAIEKGDMQDVYQLVGGKDSDRTEDKGTPSGETS